MSETTAILLLSGYAAVTVLVIAWRIRRYDVDALAWMLYCVNRLFVGLMWRWRSNRPCPLPSDEAALVIANHTSCLLYTSPSPRDKRQSRMPSSA